MNNLIHGAKWWKFDFHNHTPASEDFGKGDQAHKAISPEDFLLMYMNAEIDCIAITDHNTGRWIDIVKAAYEKMSVHPSATFRPIHIFPGVEITASNNVHILAVFDKSADSSTISALLGAVKFPVDSFGKFDAVSTFSVEEIINEIHGAKGIAIPAHVDKACGLFTKIEGVTLSQTLRVESLLAIEVIDKSAEKPDLYKQSKLDLAEVVGTDSHIAEQVGTNFTWVKMCNPSLDALKLALHDKEDGVIRKDEISSDPNTVLNRYFIKSLSVSNGFKAGNGTPLKIELSPWLTSIIGGRGSGKSSIINYLRIALARVDEMPEEVQNEFNKFNQIGRKNGAGMLRENIKIEAEMFKDGKLHLITYQQGSHTLSSWNDTRGNWDLPSTVSNIKSLFPIQIFNQKELYSLTGNPSKLIELIDSQFDKTAWKEAKDILVEKWLAFMATRRQLNNAVSEEANIRAQLDSTNNKISLYESSSYRETLNKFNKFSEVNKYFTHTSETVLKFISDLDNLKNLWPTFSVPEELKDVVIDESLLFLQLLSTAFDKVKEKLEESAVLVAPYKEDLTSQTNSLPWFEQFALAKQGYADIGESIKELGNETYDVLIERRGSLNDKLALIANQKDQLISLETELDTLYNLIINKEKELRSKRKEIIDRWKAVDNTTNPFLIIELEPMADTENANFTLRQLIRKSSGEFSNDIYSYKEDDGTSWGLISEIILEPQETRWEKRHAIIDRFLSSTQLDKKSLDIRFAKHLDYLKQNTPEDIDRIIIWVPEDKLILKFRKEGKEEDIQTGSAGERTAGMLGLLLALNDIPLIIDQPEDDLDTKLISKFVVDGFKKLKQNRQLVIVTHNANIAVNANSDNVVYMDFVSGQVTVAGNNALQERHIRNAVCEVMEGGRDALNKRYYRISKALK